jgi:predicted protein tyrosine phosphatase
MFEIKVCGIGQSKVERDTWATKTIGLIDPYKRNVYNGTDNYHIEFFNDIEEPVESLIGPTKKHIENIINYAKSFTDDDRILVHCHAGMSRSTAVAIGILVLHGMKPFDAFMKVYEIRPQMYPNKLIINFFGDILENSKEMDDAYDEWLVKGHWAFNNGLIIPKDPEYIKQQKREAAMVMLKSTKVMKD